jgi:hypothetical protein
MSGPQGTLIFVYNADSSPLAQAVDFLHKTVSPETYPCNLCLVTYGTFLAKPEWMAFVRSLPFRTVLLHRDEFKKRHPELAGTPLPAIYIEKEGSGLKMLADAEELNQPQNMEMMNALILSKLA